MGETTTPLPPRGLGNVQWSDVLKGFVKVAGGLILALVLTTLRNKAWPTYEQIEPILEVGATFFLSYLGINAATNNVGQIFKKDQPTVPIGVDKLKDLQTKADSNQP